MASNWFSGVDVIMSNPSAIEPQISGKRLWSFSRILQLIGSLGLWVAATFASAGTLRWLRGWICVVATLASYAVAAVMVQRKNPALMEARANWRHRDTKSFDKLFFALMLPLYYAQPLVGGLDVVRFHWSSMPFATVYAGLVLLAIGMTLVTWTMLVNPFAETTVRLQSERQQTTVTAGPYRIVRHPMYLGWVLMLVATALIFGSMWALAVGLAMVMLGVWRTTMEDRMLRRELPGYEEFAAVTRYRLFPGVW